MDPISQALSIALQYHQGGQLQEAEMVYRQILQADPNQPDALHLLGVIARQVGMNDVAIELISRAIERKGNSADYYNNLGGAYLDSNNYSQAVICFQKSVQLKPDYALAHSNLGTAFKELGQLDEANASCRRAVKIDSNNPALHLNLGNVLKEEGKLELAIASYQRALQLNPQLAQAHNNLGLIYQHGGRLANAVDCFRKAVELQPDSAEIQNNAGNVLADVGQLDDAVDRFRRALKLKPDYAEAYNNLSNVLLTQGKLEEAITCCQRALELKPDFANALNNLGNALKAQGSIQEALSCFRLAVELSPEDAEAHSNLLLSMQYSEEATLPTLLEAHRKFDAQYTAILRPSVPPLFVSGNALRLGFVSADLGRHPVGNLAIRVFENLRDLNVETVCYSDRQAKDDLTQRFQQSATQWRDTVGLSDAALAEQIQDDRIDILFDLAGHTAHNRLLTFARKPAPIQITWIGYEGTTGLSSMDYLIADQYLIPAESEQFYCEKILRMPESYVCYEPPQNSPPVGAPPLEQSKHVTFGSFNNLAKLTSQVIRVWSQILNRVQDARLVLKYRGLGDESVRNRFYEAFGSHGITSDRIDLLPSTGYDDYLSAFHQLDFALDPFPFNGGATTCETLWMGVPIITCPGQTFPSRHSYSYLSTIGVTETIASNMDHYIDLAVELAHDTARLRALRAGLRGRMADSPLCDGKRFASNFIALLKNLHGEPK